MENLDSEDLDQNSNVDNSINNGKNQVNFLSFVPRAIFVYAFVAACLISVTAKLLIMYNLQFGDELSDSNGDWGTFGDYLGGVLNPILGFASFMALLYTVRLQSNELKNSNEQLAQSAKAQTEMEKTQKLQQFEGLFTHMATELNKIYDELDKDSRNITNYLNLKMPKFTDEEREKLKWELRNDFNLVRFFMYLYQTLKHIDSLDEKVFKFKFKKRYSNIIRASLENEVLQLIFLNSLVFQENSNEFEEYRNLLEKYNFLEHMTFKINSKFNYWLIYFSQYYKKQVFDKSYYFLEIFEDEYFSLIATDKKFSNPYNLLIKILDNLFISDFSSDPLFSYTFHELKFDKNNEKANVNEARILKNYRFTLPSNNNLIHKLCKIVEKEIEFNFKNAYLIKLDENIVSFRIKSDIGSYFLFITMNRKNYDFEFYLTDDVNKPKLIYLSPRNANIRKFIKNKI